MSSANNRLKRPILIHRRRSETVRDHMADQAFRARLSGMLAKRRRIQEGVRKVALQKAVAS